MGWQPRDSNAIRRMPRRLIPVGSTESGPAPIAPDSDATGLPLGDTRFTISTTYERIYSARTAPDPTDGSLVDFALLDVADWQLLREDDQ